ncbi:KAP family P-loop NTPase fold protein [Qipengyuania sp.]|uniref:KAP family P-loop NTPase fold protein n=1 Tax=Qipengyuania sp. TaxID=2004515 RepID=UPI003AF6D818
MQGDRPLGSGSDDKLGFREVASQISLSLIDHASDQGFVIGIEGAWGSGKSSLLYLIEDELSKLPKPERPSLINFRPWLVGNRDALLSNLFSALSKEINLVAFEAGDATGISKEKAKVAGEALRKFAAGLGRAGAAIELTGDAIAFAPLKWFGKGASAVGKTLGKKSSNKPLEVLKERLVRSLDDLGHRFIITIDDVDRLEPAEIVEVLRLARSVADLPNVIYLLCYDSDILAHSIEQASGVENGRAYLEKIVQLTVMVPKPEPFRLRQWFGDELRQLSPTISDEQLSRLRTVIDYEGGRQLKTPRAVIRALDAIRLFWPPVRAVNGDLADLVWIQLIKNGNPPLYRWIEEYCATAALFSIGTVRVDDAERQAQLETLQNSVEPNHFADHMYRYYFAEPLPGVDVSFAQDGQGFDIFQRVPDGVRDAAISAGRLASPDHYRIYFALSGPSHALTQSDFDAFWNAADSGSDEVETALLQLHQVELTGTFGKADLLLERLKGADDAVLTSDRCRNILLAMANAMDTLYRLRPFDIDWVTSLWDRATLLMPRLLARLEGDTRRETIEQMFGQGHAIGWLTKLMRKETFAHGRYGSREKPEQEWLLTDEELDRVFEIMLARFRRMVVGDLLEAIHPLDILFAWRQAGDEAGPRDFVEKHVQTDGGLVEMLEKLTTIHSSSERGSYSVLTRENVSPFLDFDASRERINAAAIADEGLSERAAVLGRAFGDDD